METVFTGVVALDVEPDSGLLEDFAVRVLVTGPADAPQLPYVKTFEARFDDEPVEAVTVDTSGTGFAGYLKNKPPGTARLFVRFEGEDEIDTGLDYSAGGLNT